MSIATDFEVHRTVHISSLESLRHGLPSGLPDQLAEVTPILRVYDDAIANIERDETLSAIGKDAQLKAAHDVAVAGIEQWKSAKVAGIDGQMVAQHNALMTEVDKSLPEPTELQISNMVTQLSGFDPLELEILYADATDAERRVIEAAADAIGRRPIKRGD